MDSAIVKKEADEELFVIDEKVEGKVDLAKVRPLQLKKEEPIAAFADSHAAPRPSTSRATATWTSSSRTA